MHGRSGPAARVLVVDDEPAVRRALGRELGAHFEVVMAEDAVTALATLARTEGLSAVVSDLMMPGLSGTELLAEVRRLRPECARVLVSGALERAGADVLAAGIADEVLSKPWRFGEVAEAVRRALAKSGRRP